MKSLHASALLVLPLMACTTSVEPSSSSADEALLTDVASATQNPDGTFNVTCKDGRSGIVSAAQFTSGNVCNSITLDPWAADSCTGDPLTEERALAYFGGDAPVELGQYRVVARRRTCTAAGCTPWGNDTRIPFVAVEHHDASLVDPVNDVYPVDRVGHIVLSFRQGSLASHAGIDLSLVPVSSSIPSFRVSFTTPLASGFAKPPPSYELGIDDGKVDPTLRAWIYSLFLARKSGHAVPMHGLRDQDLATWKAKRTLTAKVTDHCVRVALEDRDHDGSEVQAVFIGAFAPPP